MSAQPQAIETLFSSAAATDDPTQQAKAIIEQLQRLGRGKSVGPNYYLDTKTLSARFSDYDSGPHYLVLTAAEIHATTRYLAGCDDPADAPVLTLLNEGRNVIARWADYNPTPPVAPAPKFSGRRP